MIYKIGTVCVNAVAMLKKVDFGIHAYRVHYRKKENMSEERGKVTPPPQQVFSLVG
jgi:hypothetical protein